MSKKKVLSPEAQAVFNFVKKHKNGVRSVDVAVGMIYSNGGADYHLHRLLKSRHIKRDKKTKVWSVK